MNVVSTSSWTWENRARLSIRIDNSEAKTRSPKLRLELITHKGLTTKEHIGALSRLEEIFEVENTAAIKNQAVKFFVNVIGFNDFMR